MSDQTAPIPAHGSALGLAVHAIMQNLGGDAALVGAHADDEVTPGQLARVGKKFVIVEHMANMVTNLTHTFTVFRIGETEGERFKLSRERAAGSGNRGSERNPAPFSPPLGSGHLGCGQLIRADAGERPPYSRDSTGPGRPAATPGDAPD